MDSDGSGGRVTATDALCTIDGVRLHYRDWGDRHAPALVLLHGGSAHAHWWDTFAAAMADVFHVVAPDLRGHGDSAHLDPAAYATDDYVRDLAGLADRLRLERFALVGHSLGGLISAAYAAAHADRLTALVVVDSQLKITPAGARYMQRLQRFPQPRFGDLSRAITRFRLLPVHTSASPAILAHVAEHGLRQLPDGHWTLKFDRATLAHMVPQDLTPLLARVRCPILFVRGAHSTLLSSAALVALAHASPQSEAVEVPAAHHHVMLDNPSGFETAVRSFLLRVHAGIDAGPAAGAPIST